MSAKQALNDKLQGSLATYLRCDGVVNNQIKKGLFTGVDKGGPGGPDPPMAEQKIFFVKIEGLLEPVVLNLSFRVRSNAKFTYERRY